MPMYAWFCYRGNHDVHDAGNRPSAGDPRFAPTRHRRFEGGGRGARGPPAQRMQTALAVAQVALCLALLVGANLMIRSFLSLQRADIGFDDGPVLTMRVYLAGDAFDEPRVRAAFFDRALQSLRSLPGVTAVAATTSIPGDDGGAPCGS